MSDLYRISDQDDIRILTVFDLISDYSNRQILESIQRSIDSGKLHYIVDLSNIQVMNSVGLNFLLTLRARSEERGGHLVICGIHQRVQQLLEMTKLTSMFDLASDVEESLQRHRQHRV